MAGGLQNTEGTHIITHTHTHTFKQGVHAYAPTTKLIGAFVANYSVQGNSVPTENILNTVTDDENHGNCFLSTLVMVKKWLFPVCLGKHNGCTPSVKPKPHRCIQSWKELDKLSPVTFLEDRKSVV